MSRNSQKVIFIFFLAVVFFPKGTALAHGVAYYELNPDRYTTKPYVISSATSTVSLLFEPQNDFLSSFDFWLDNNGDAGDVTFNVKNSAGSLLASRTITIGHIATISGGVRTHVDLLTQIPVVNTKIYSVEIKTDMPKLQLYYVNRVEIVGYQERTFSPYLIGVTKIGSVEQVFTFKYALYEAADKTPPVIYATSTQNISDYSTKLFWSANEPMDFRIEYGKNSDGIVTSSTTYNNSFTSCGEGDIQCFMSLTVIPGTDYFYNLYAKDSWGNEGVTYGIFKSSGILPTTPVNTISNQPNNGQNNNNTNTNTTTNNYQNPQNQSQIPTPQNNVTDKSDGVSVTWTPNDSANEYFVTITGKNTGYTDTQTVPKNSVNTSFKNIPPDTYSINVYSVTNSGDKKILEETATKTNDSNPNLYLIIGGSILFILIVLAVVYNKYKEYL